MELTGFDIVQIIDSLKAVLYHKEKEQAILNEIKELIVNNIDADENADIIVDYLEMRVEIYHEISRQARWLQGGRRDMQNLKR